MGQWADARPALARAAELADQLGDRRRGEESVAHLAHVDYYQGNFALSAKLRAEVDASARRRGVVEGQVWGLVGRMPILLILDYLDSKTLRRAGALLAEPLSRSDVLMVWESLARAWLRRGDPARAREAADAAAELIAAAPPITHHAIHACAGVAEVYLALWEAGLFAGPADERRLRRAIRRACTALHALARVFPIAAPPAWRQQGLYEWLAGRPTTAARAWRRSLAAAESLAMPYEQALTHYELGRHLPDPDHLAQAAQLFTQLGAAYDLARVAGAE